MNTRKLMRGLEKCLWFICAVPLIMLVWVIENIILLKNFRNKL